MAKLGITAALALALAVSGCGGGGNEGDGGATPSGPFAVTISWTANRESTVNSPGGGYEVTISGQPAVIDVPYVSGPTAPTSVTVMLTPGVYNATVRAYAAFAPEGGTRTFSAPEQLSVVFR